MTKLSGSSFAPWLFAIVAGCLATIGMYYVDQLEQRRLSQELRVETFKRLSHIRAEIEGKLSSDLQLFVGMATHFSIHPDFSADEFARFGQALMAQSNNVRSIGVSEEYIVQHVYPLKGNEKAIGLNYLTSESQREPVLRAVKNRETVLAGPITLAQGGQALIGRLPIFASKVDSDNSSEAFLGIVSVLIDIDTLFKRVGVLAPDSGIEIAIRGRDGTGVEGEVFLGSETIFTGNPIFLDISLPGGRWRIAAAPDATMRQTATQASSIIRIMGGALIFLFICAVFFLSRQLQQQKKIIAVEAESKEQIWHAATHDRLTGMANRFLFSEELRHYIAQSKRSERRLAVLFCDLDGFKDINDSFGHQVGDMFLKILAEKMTRHIRESELVARLGGDEFAIVNSDVENIEEAASLAQRIVEIVSEPVEVGRNTLRAGVSIGIAIYPDDGDSAEELLHNADLAMYKAKQDARSRYAFFEESMNLEVQENKQLIDDIRTGIEEKEFILVYQPVIDIQRGRVIGVEALARWYQADRGTVSPATFIPAAEKSGLILPFGEWVMKQACDDVGQPLRNQDEAVELSINLSPIQLHRGDPIKLVKLAILHCQIPPDRLDIEITESAILEDVGKATEIVKALRKTGVSVTIDDFGTGYSSLSHLRHLRANRIKLDMSFIRGIGKDSHSEAIIKSILFLSNLLDTRVTAEGVETAEQLEFLQQHGCQEIQGYYFSKPLAAQELFEFIKNFSMQQAG